MPTSAHRLHDLLRDVQAQGAAPVSVAWAKVLGAEPDSPEFARRHARAVNLLLETARDLEALPEPGRERGAAYLPAWWRAVIGADQTWASPSRGSAQSVISRQDLDQLAATADLLAARLGGTALSPAATDLDRLAREIRGWLGLVEQTTDLTAGLAAQLRSQLAHLLWLVEQSQRFGASAAARAADEVLGTLMRASVEVADPASQNKWRKQYAALVATVALLTAGPAAAREALEATAGVMRAFESNVRAAHGVRDALDGAPSGELPQSPASP